MKKIIALMMAIAVIASMGIVSSMAEESVAEPVWFWDLGEFPGYSGDPSNPLEENPGYSSIDDINGDGMIYPTTEDGFGIGTMVDPLLGPVDCSIVKYVVVKMRVTLSVDMSSTTLQVLNHGMGANGVGHASVSVMLENTKDWQYPIADMTGVDHWDNASNTAVSWFRIDPVNQNGASADVAWVAMFETIEDAQAYIDADKNAVESTEEPTVEPTVDPTEEPVEETAEPTDEATEAPAGTTEATKAPEATDAAEEEGGCGSVIGGIGSVAAAMVAAVLFLKKRR